MHPSPACRRALGHQRRRAGRAGRADRADRGAASSCWRQAGLTTWRVWHKGQWHDTWPSVLQRFPRKCPQLQSLFPPSEAAAAAMGLHRCVRLLPHDQDCGGFFVAVFEK
eukprot:1244656-Prymnesium_polylepis.1